MCIILLMSLLCSVCFSSGPVSLLSGTACRHPAFPWLPSPSHALCGLGNSPFPRVAVFGAYLCVCAHVCVLPICISMSLTQSICYTSSGTNLSNLIYVWCPKILSDSYVCVSACCKQPRIILHYSYNALSKMSLHIWSCVHVFSRLQEADQMPNYM